MNVYNKIVWGCGAMIVLLAGSVMLGLFPSEPEAKNASIDLLVGTYGEIYIGMSLILKLFRLNLWKRLKRIMLHM